MNNLISKILQLAACKYYTQNSRYVPFCDKVCFVPTCPLFTDKDCKVLCYAEWGGAFTASDNTRILIMDLATLDLWWVSWKQWYPL